MTDLDQIQQMLDRHRAEISEAAVVREKKGSRIDWKGWIGLSLGILGVVAAFTMFIFKTNAAANLEHERITAAQKLDAQRLDGRIANQSQRLDAQSNALGEVLNKLDTVNENQIRIGERLKVRGLRSPDSHP